MKLTERFDGKRILIWGYGREGKSTQQFLQAHCKCAKLDVYEGKADGFDADSYDFIFKSPGIYMEEENPKFTSQTEFFLESFRDKIVGVTGTKGKSTTSSLLYHVLNRCSGKNVLLMGNIGLPCLDYYDEIDEDSIVVFEMSCHQLMHAKVSPHVAVFLNLFEEHLDYYKTLDKYFTAKSHIAAYQKEGDFFYKGGNVPEIQTKATTKVINFEERHDFEMKLIGEHNRFNARFVYDIACDVYGCDEGDVRREIAEFAGLPHRLELVMEHNGIRFYDDSISTIPGATVEAVKGIENVGVVLVGGMDRGIDYSLLIDFINSDVYPGVRYIFMYETGRRIYDALETKNNCQYVPDLKSAVAAAKTILVQGEALVLSPAAASYGYFKNFEERGERFKEYCREYFV